SLQARGVMDVAHLDGARGRSDPEVARDPRGLPLGLVEDREEERVVAEARRAHPAAIVRERAERAVGEVGPAPRPPRPRRRGPPRGGRGRGARADRTTPPTAGAAGRAGVTSPAAKSR